MIPMMRLSARLHWLLSAYLWLIAWIPLGNWNRQREGTLLQAIHSGAGVHAGDWGMLVFVTLPAVLFWVAYRRNSFWLAVLALTLDVVWLVLQIQSWWIPYIFGTEGWQLAYAKGPTTKVLPSFGHHVAPDGMHFLIQVLLFAALMTGIVGLRQLERVHAANPLKIPPG
ncbi:MAG TPA: hypothetical protein VGR55_21045 [Candidatus Acidoferrum sp.]|nr:hypothetical protein [Candidatus Acidoferrum sp.]